MRFYQDNFKCGVHVDDVFCSGTFDNENLELGAGVLHGPVGPVAPNKGVKRLLG
jgi:hypothetical protein